MSITYSFTQNDVDAITTALTVLPAYDFFVSDIADAAFVVSASAGQNLISQKPLTKREIALVALAVDSAYKALRDELNLDSNYLSRLRPHFFTYNKLHPVFAPFLVD